MMPEMATMRERQPRYCTRCPSGRYSLIRLPQAGPIRLPSTRNSGHQDDEHAPSCLRGDRQKGEEDHRDQQHGLQRRPVRQQVVPGAGEIDRAHGEQEGKGRNKIGNSGEQADLLGRRSEEDGEGDQEIIEGADRDLGSNAFLPGIAEAVLDLRRQCSSNDISHGR